MPVQPRPALSVPVAALRLEPWIDPVVDALGHDPRSAYVETFWLPLLGPTATWALRSFAARFDLEPTGFEVDLADAARAIGVGGNSGGPYLRSLDRCIRFGLAQRIGHDAVAVRRRIPPLTRVQASRLPRRLQGAHQRWLDDQLRRHHHPAHHGHAARLARSLLDVGASAAEIEDQLRRWRFDQSTARRAIQSALDARRVPPDDAPPQGDGRPQRVEEPGRGEAPGRVNEERNETSVRTP